jgi:hypothetical protein
VSSPTWLLRQKSDGIQQKSDRLVGFLFGGYATSVGFCLKIWLRLHRTSSTYLPVCLVGTLCLADIFKQSII